MVEDNDDVRRIVTKQIAELGYAVIEARSSKAGARLAQGPAGQDRPAVHRPGDAGRDERARAGARRDRRARPACKALFTSGYSDSSLRGDERLREDEHFLSKPYRKQDLARKLEEIFSR